MIFTKVKLIAAGVGFAALLGAFTWFYFEGKEEAREECLAAEAEARQILEEALAQAREQNKELAQHLAETMSEIDNASRARTKTIIKYVESDPDSNTVVFDADGLSLLNDAQKGPTTNAE